MLTHPQVPGQCARFLRGELRAGAGAAGELDRRGGADRDREADGAGQAALGHRAGGARSTAARCCARASGPRRQRNALRVAGARRASRRERPPLRGARAGDCEDLAGVLGPRRRAARAGSCAACEEFARREINLTQDRVAPAARAARQLHVLRRPRRPRGRASAVARGDRGAARRCARRCACSAPTAAPPAAGGERLRHGRPRTWRGWQRPLHCRR